MRKLRSRTDLDSKEQGRDLKSGVSTPKTYALLLGIKFSQCRSYLFIVANSSKVAVFSCGLINVTTNFLV